MGGEEVNLIKYPALTLDDMNDNWKEWVFSLDSLIYTYFKEEGFNDGVIIFKDLPFYQRVSTYWLSKVFTLIVTHSILQTLLKQSTI